MVAGRIVKDAAMVDGIASLLDVVRSLNVAGASVQINTVEPCCL